MVRIGNLLVNVWLIVIIILAVVAFIVMSVIKIIRAHQRQVEAGVEELIGKKAVAKTALSPKGDVFIEGELWAAISESGQIGAGEEVVITRVDGLTLYVTKKQRR